MYRRLSTAACTVALAVALIVAVSHDHRAAATAASAAADACMYCSGGVTASQAPEIIQATQTVWRVQARIEPVAPASRRILPLAHSGNAPPA